MSQFAAGASEPFCAMVHLAYVSAHADVRPYMWAEMVEPSMVKTVPLPASEIAIFPGCQSYLLLWMLPLCVLSVVPNALVRQTVEGQSIRTSIKAVV